MNSAREHENPMTAPAGKEGCQGPWRRGSLQECKTLNVTNNNTHGGLRSEIIHTWWLLTLSALSTPLPWTFCMSDERRDGWEAAHEREKRALKGAPSLGDGKEQWEFSSVHINEVLNK